VDDAKNCVMIVGFQAPHTLGRRIVERRPSVKIFGVQRELRAEVVVMNGFSAHADRKDLLAYAADARERGGVEHVILVHGDPKPMQALSEQLGSHGFGKVSMPAQGDRIEV
jgi:metallo-beta-lactamase family protein